MSRWNMSPLFASVWCVLLWLSVCADISFAASDASEKVVLCASGRIEPKSEERELYFPVAGRISKIHVKEGQEVKEGDMLVELENEEEKAHLALSKSEVERAAAALRRLENGARQEERAIAEAEVTQALQALEKLKKGARKEERRQAEARLARWEAERRINERLVKRLRKLREGEVKAATVEDLENAEEKFTMAQATAAEAQANFDLVSASGREEDIKMSEAQYEIQKQRAAMIKGKAREEDLAMARAKLAAAESQREAAEARLKKTTMRSPVNGVVLKMFSREGEMAMPSARRPVMIVGDTSSLVIRTEVDENDISKIHEGQRVYARAAAFGSKQFPGKLVSVGLSMGRKRLFSDSPREKLDTRVLEVLVELDGETGLPIGFRMDVYFIGGK